MRTVLFSLLLASVASAPALAERPRDRNFQAVTADQAQTSESPRGERSERSERPSFGDDRGERGDGRERPSFGANRDGPREQPRFDMPEQRAPRTMTADPGWQRRGSDDSPLHAGRDPRPAFERGGVQEDADQLRQRLERRDEATRESNDPDANRMWSERRRPDRGTNPQVSSVPRLGTQPPARVDGRRSPVEWNRTTWRHDGRYDWQNHRRHHRSLFHVGVYFDPFGWGYRPFQVGWRMWADYYSSRYWINDPWMYRLPYAPPGTRWIRYWDDAILVDTWSGQVIDAIPNFFW